MSETHMAREMAEQPARLRELIGRFDAVVERVREVAPVPLNGICMVARGSSDHAAVYGRYLLEAATGKPVSLAAPSLHTLYGVHVDYSGQLVIGVSQSGATPEIVRTLQALQDAGGRGLAITNDPESALAEAADETIELEVGRERAVPATKTVTGQFAALAIAACALGRAPFTFDELEAVPGWVQEVSLRRRTAAAANPARETVPPARHTARSMGVTGEPGAFGDQGPTRSLAQTRPHPSSTTDSTLGGLRGAGCGPLIASCAGGYTG